MTTFESAEVQIATLKARNAKLLLDLADLDHITRMHALHGLADAREALARLREKVAGPGHDPDPAFALIDAQLSDVAHKLEHRQCSCSRADRVALELGDEPLPGKVVEIAEVRRALKVRSLFRDVISTFTNKDPKGGGAA